jgi:hypothetical protein
LPAVHSVASPAVISVSDSVVYVSIVVVVVF